MNKIIFSLCVILIVSISILFGTSHNVYYEKENSNFILPKFIFENQFVQEVILISIPTASVLLTSLYVTNTWQIRKEKLELQRKILGEVDNSIVKCLQILKNFDRMLLSKYTIVNTSNKSENKEKESENKEEQKDDKENSEKPISTYETDFPKEESEFPSSKFKKEYDEFLIKYAEETFELWKFSSTIKLYYDEKLFDDFDKLVKSLEPAFLELLKLFNSKNKEEFDSFHREFMSKRTTIEHHIIKFKEDLVKGKIKKLNV